MNGAHRALRAATAAAHERVDATFGGFDLADRAGYTRFLQAHAAAFLPIEAALDGGAAEAVTDDWATPRRGVALLRDLADLNAAVPEGASWTDATDPASAAGMLYVLEGSRLGGRLLSRSVPAGFPKRYIDADHDTRRWRSLLDRLDDVLEDPRALSRAIEAADRVFLRFADAGREWSSSR